MQFRLAPASAFWQFTASQFRSVSACRNFLTCPLKGALLGCPGRVFVGSQAKHRDSRLCGAHVPHKKGREKGKVKGEEGRGRRGREGEREREREREVGESQKEGRGRRKGGRRKGERDGGTGGERERVRQSERARVINTQLSPLGFKLAREASGHAPDLISVQWPLALLRHLHGRRS